MRQDFHRPMRTVALEEHFSIPELVARLPAERLAAQGNPPPAQWPALIRATHAALVELGASRIADLDANGITLQVGGSHRGGLSRIGRGLVGGAHSTARRFSVEHRAGSLGQAAEACRRRRGGELVGESPLRA